MGTAVCEWWWCVEGWAEAGVSWRGGGVGSRLCGLELWPIPPTPNTPNASGGVRERVVGAVMADGRGMLLGAEEEEEEEVGGWGGGTPLPLPLALALAAVAEAGNRRGEAVPGVGCEDETEAEANAEAEVEVEVDERGDALFVAELLAAEEEEEEEAEEAEERLLAVAGGDERRTDTKAAGALMVLLVLGLVLELLVLLRTVVLLEGENRELKGDAELEVAVVVEAKGWAALPSLRRILIGESKPPLSPALGPPPLSALCGSPPDSRCRVRPGVDRPPLAGAAEMEVSGASAGELTLCANRLTVEGGETVLMGRTTIEGGAEPEVAVAAADGLSDTATPEVEAVVGAEGDRGGSAPSRLLLVLSCRWWPPPLTPAGRVAPNPPTLFTCALVPSLITVDSSGGGELDSRRLRPPNSVDRGVAGAPALLAARAVALFIRASGIWVVGAEPGDSDGDTSTERCKR